MITITEKECSAFIETSQSNSWKSANHWKAGFNMDKTALTTSGEGIKEKNRDSYIKEWDSFKKYINMDAECCRVQRTDAYWGITTHLLSQSSEWTQACIFYNVDYLL